MDLGGHPRGLGEEPSLLLFLGCGSAFASALTSPPPIRHKVQHVYWLSKPSAKTSFCIQCRMRVLSAARACRWACQSAGPSLNTGAHFSRKPPSSKLLSGSEASVTPALRYSKLLAILFSLQLYDVGSWSMWQHHSQRPISTSNSLSFLLRLSFLAQGSINLI